MASNDQTPAEIELKLSLPGADAQTIAKQLASLPPLAGIASKQQRLRNIYFDTPEQHLRQHKAALRLRSVRVGKGRARWQQTFKTSGSGSSGLSKRGEWESSLKRGTLDAALLEGTPWQGIAGDDDLLPQLAACFETTSTRTLWQVHESDGSQIEVALDVGTIEAAGQTMPICELELELVQGSVDALFALAEQIAARVAVLPTATSKAERGWRLLVGTSATPLRARPPLLSPDMSTLVAAQTVLSEMFGQFTENLSRLLHFDQAELVHQARVGWRRWRSGLWLFKPLLKHAAAPDASGLAAVRQALGPLRDLDVAALESLPPWADAFVAGDANRAAEWRSMEETVNARRRAQRQVLLDALSTPEAGMALLQIGRWLHALPLLETEAKDIGPWAEKRTSQLRKRLKREIKHARTARERDDPDALEQEHEARLLAKRTRYCLEAMQSLLPKSRTREWIKEATEVQTRIGAERDLMVLTELLGPLGADRAILGFLRGVAAARITPE